MANPFFTDGAKKRITEAVRNVESATRAEIVVSVRARSDDYRDVDWLVGAFLALATMFVLIYHPREMDEELMPLEALVAFALSSVLVSKIAPLKRLLVRRRRFLDRVLAAARAHFVEAGISRTRERTGILVYASLLERTVSVVCDVGIDEKIFEGWPALVLALEAAVKAQDPEAFARSLEAFGPPLAKAYAIREDDVNELPDAPDVGEGVHA